MHHSQQLRTWQQDATTTSIWLSLLIHPPFQHGHLLRHSLSPPGPRKCTISVCDYFTPQSQANQISRIYFSSQTTGSDRAFAHRRCLRCSSCSKLDRVKDVVAAAPQIRSEVSNKFYLQCHNKCKWHFASANIKQWWWIWWASKGGS